VEKSKPLGASHEGRKMVTQEEGKDDEPEGKPVGEKGEVGAKSQEPGGEDRSTAASSGNSG